MRLERTAGPPAARLLAAGGLAFLVLLSGCSNGDDPEPPSTAATTSHRPTPSATATQTPAAQAPVVEIKDPIGACLETTTTIEPPTDPEELCTYRRMVVGHTMPPGEETYLSRLVPDLPVGAEVQLQGQRWRVSEVTSIPKTELPDAMYAEDGPERYLVTCDPESGYTRWSDGQMHSNNNLVLTLLPQ